MTEVTKNVKEKEQVAEAAETEQRVVETPIGNRFVLVRKDYSEDPEKQLWTYYIEGKRGERTFTITIVPSLKSFGDGKEKKTEYGFTAYQSLDFLFEGAVEIYLEQRKQEYVDKLGEVKTTYPLYAVGIDANGVKIDLPVKTYGNGDDNLLKMLVSGFGGIVDANRHKFVDHSEKKAEGKTEKLPQDELPF